MLTIMLFTVLLAVSDAAEAPRISKDDVWTYLNGSKSRPGILAGCRVAPEHPDTPKDYHPTSAGIILRGNDEKYLLFQEKKSGKFGYPSGNVDYAPRSKNPDKWDFGAALREFEEETGFPLLEMIAASANRCRRSLRDMVSGRRLPLITDKKGLTHVVFLVDVDIALFHMLTKFPGKGAMCPDLKTDGLALAETIKEAHWGIYGVGALAKTPREGDFVALATLDQMRRVHYKKEGHYYNSIVMRGGKYCKDTKNVKPGPYLKALESVERRA